MDRERVALVDRADRPLGAAVARLFDDEGWTVFAAAPEADRLDVLGATGCRTVAVDLANGDDGMAVCNRIEREHGHLDALVLGPGTAAYGAVERLDAADLRRGYDATVVGPHRLVRTALPLLRPAEGTIVSVTSAARFLAAPGTGAPSGAAAARRALTDALRTELLGQGVHVVGVDVGPLAVPEGEADAASGVEDETDATADARADEPSPTTARARTATDGGEGTDRYAWVDEWVTDTRFLAPAGPWATDPVDVASTVVDAAGATRPDAQYAVGPAARWLATLRYVPPRWRDRAFRLVARLLDR